MKVLYDTNLYINLLRNQAHLSLFTDRSHVRFLCPIVMMELIAGAQTRRQKRAVDQLIDPYSRAGRIIPVTTSIFYKAGQCLAKLKIKKSISPGFSHDVLIAFSALSIGATLFTNNKKDFEKIAYYVPLKVEFIKSFRAPLMGAYANRPQANAY